MKTRIVKRNKPKKKFHAVVEVEFESKDEAVELAAILAVTSSLSDWEAHFWPLFNTSCDLFDWDKQFDNANSQYQKTKEKIRKVATRG